MSKLAIILCAALFASAANASIISTPLDEAQKNLNNLIDSTVAQVKNIIADAKRVYEELTAQIEAQVLEYEEKVANDVGSKLQKGVDEVNDLICAVESIDVTECTKFTIDLQSAAEAALLEVRKCFAGKVATAAGYVESMLQIAENVLASLIAHKEEAHKCIDDVNDLFSVPKGLLCTSAVAAKAVLTTATAVPSVTFEILKLTQLLKTLIPTLGYCTTVHALDIFYHQVSIISSSTNECIKEIIDKSHKTAPPTTSVPKK